MKDPYLVLGVPKTASPDEIKQSYRKLARKFHPDVNPGNKKAEERFKEVSAAHDVLGDPKKRALYDEFGADGLREAFDPERARAAQRWAVHGARGTGPRVARDEDEEVAEGFGGFEDLFGDLFGRTRRARAPRKGGDAEARLSIDFMQAVRGGEIPVTLRGERGERTLKVKIPPGIDDGARIRLAGQGQPGPGGAGDLYVDIAVRPHAVFRRDGKTLLLDLPITIGEAVAGAKIPVPTPSGDVMLTIPSGSQSGSQLRLKGRGIDGGDMIVTIAVQAPDADSPGARELAQKLDAHYRRDVRRGVRL